MAQPIPRNPLEVSETVVEKLKALNYEQEFLSRYPELRPVPRNFFAYATQQAQQFTMFHLIVQHLFRVLQVDFIEWTEFDDPNSTMQTILDVSRKIGCPVELLQPAKLRLGSGDLSCLLLDWLCDQCLGKRRWRPMPPDWSKIEIASADADTDQPPMEADDEEEIEADFIQADDDEPVFDAPSLSNAGSSVSAHSAEEEREILVSRVDPAQWKMNAERLAPRLKLKSQVSFSTLSRSALIFILFQVDQQGVENALRCLEGKSRRPR